MHHETSIHVRAGVLACALAIPLSTALAAPTSAPIICSVLVDYQRLTQAGAIVASEAYAQTFTVAPGIDFIDDFSTPTRQKQFSVSVEALRQTSVLSISYFNDVDTFDSVEFSTQLTLPNNQREGAVSGHQRFSTSLDPLNGHFDVDYTLRCAR